MILAIDYGKKRCGYAYGEIFPSKLGVASPSEVLEILEELKPEVVVVGLPLSMSGRYSCQTFEVMEFAEKIHNLGFKVRLVDERLTTKTAHEILRSTGGNSPVDAVSASIIFEVYSKNPDSSYEIPEYLPRVDVEEIEAESVLLYNVPDPGTLERLKADRIEVLQEDPYIAYLFKKKVRFVERDIEMLKGPYDVCLVFGSIHPKLPKICGKILKVDRS